MMKLGVQLPPIERGVRHHAAVPKKRSCCAEHDDDEVQRLRTAKSCMLRKRAVAPVAPRPASSL